MDETPKQTTMFDLHREEMTASKHSEAEKRDKALDQVIANAGEDWQSRAMKVLEAMPDEFVTGEDIRLACLRQNIEPHHHNAWGAFIANLVRSEVLLGTGRYVSMQAKGSHARKTQLYAREATIGWRKLKSEKQ